MKPSTRRKPWAVISTACLSKSSQRRFHQPQLVHQAGEALIVVQRELPLHAHDEPRVAGRHVGVGPLVLVAVEIDVLRVAHQAAEDFGKLVQPFDRFDARNLLGFFLGVLMTFPNLQFFNRLAEEQDLALVPLIGGLREERQDRLLLLDAGEIEQIGIGRQRHRAVGIGRQHVDGVYHGESELGNIRAASRARF